MHTIDQKFPINARGPRKIIEIKEATDNNICEILWKKKLINNFFSGTSEAISIFFNSLEVAEKQSFGKK